jgi:positive regulator of sigma E activity
MQLNENHEDIAIVTAIQKSVITVELTKSGACNSCAMRGICMGKNASVQHDIESDLPLQIGDSVRIFIEPKYKLLSSFLLFIFPILVMILIYLLCFFVFNWQESISILITFASLIPSGIFIYLIDKKLRHKLQGKILEKVEK